MSIAQNSGPIGARMAQAAAPAEAPRSRARPPRRWAEQPPPRESFAQARRSIRACISAGLAVAAGVPTNKIGGGGD